MGWYTIEMTRTTTLSTLSPEAAARRAESAARPLNESNLRTLVEQQPCPVGFAERAYY